MSIANQIKVPGQVKLPGGSGGSGSGSVAIGDITDWPSGVSVTELGYLNDVTSDIQAQINGKANTSHTHAINDTTGLQAALDALAIAVGGNAINGNKTVSGTETMTSAQYWDTLTVPNGATLVADSYPIFARRIVISGTGKIHCNGGNAGSPDHWTEGAPRTARELGPSGSGRTGIGNNGTGAGVAGVAGGGISSGLGGLGGASGASGAGSGGAGAAGAAGGPMTGSQLAGWARLNFSLLFFRGASLVGGGTGGACGAAGGGNGSGSYSGGTSAGGGGGGGVLAFCCGELDISAAQAGCIQAVGGNAHSGSASNGGTNAGGAGGSGGGGGGYIYGLCGEITGTLADALDASGGAGGNAGNGNGSGVGGTGGTGGAGGNIDVCDLSTGTWYSARGVAGTAGSAPSGTTGGTGGAGGACKLSL